jgi:hypothetical protein
LFQPTAQHKEHTMAEKKIGAGSLQAMGRLGLQELRNALHAQSNVAASTEKGMYGTALPSEVQEQRSAETVHENADGPISDPSTGQANSSRPLRGLDSLRESPAPRPPAPPGRDDRDREP